MSTATERPNPDQRSIEVLHEQECVTLLTTQEVGRLCVVEGGHPMVFPVNYAMRGDEVVFRTADGMKLVYGQRAPVCFEVDSFDRAARAGWSVIVRGRLAEVDAHDRAALRAEVLALGVEPWAPGPKDHWVRVIPRSITGRRLSPPAPASV